MALSTLVKISGVNNLSDARYCAGMGAGILGFCPEPGNPDYVDLKKFRAITGWVQGVRLAGEFYNPTAEFVIRSDQEYHFDLIQINQPGLIGAIIGTGKPVILSIDLSTLRTWKDAGTVMKRISGMVEYFLIEGQIPSDDWLKEICESANEFRIILGTGINKENLQGIYSKCNFAGLALKGSGEIKPGYLEPGELGEIMEWLEKDI